jgi:ribosomal protein L7Ae-like RNA K-turn-binding protein
MSLCMKAGKLATGETAAQAALRNGTAFLVVIAGDASDNTKKKFINKSFYYNKPAVIFGDKDTLSKSVGRQNRSVFVITDIHLAKKLHDEILEVDECQKREYTS